MVTKGRPYQYYDARDPDYLVKLMKSAQDKSGLFIIDGGGNRSAFDKWIAPSMDLMIIPITPDPEDVKQTLIYGENLVKHGIKNIRYLLNRYPSNAYERNFIQQYINLIPENMIIGKLQVLSALRTIFGDDKVKFKTPPSKVNNFCRHTYRVTSKELENQRSL